MFLPLNNQLLPLSLTVEGNEVVAVVEATVSSLAPRIETNSGVIIAVILVTPETLARTSMESLSVEHFWVAEEVTDLLVTLVHML